MKNGAATLNDFCFLSGTGEMAELTRNFDWSSTSIGTPDTWPQSLRLTLSMVLASKFPMFLWWGDDLIQFYNDAYRPSFGNQGKHPLALGQTGEECWSEIWPIISPLIEQVRQTGIGTWSEDQLIPIYRNGKIEDVYWTFSFSPVYGNSQTIDGILVVCTETTEKVKAIKTLAESELRFRSIADNIPNLAWMADAEGYIYWYNQKWYEYTGTTIDQMEGWGWQSVHDPATLSNVLENWKKSLATLQPFEMVFPLKGADGQFRKFLTRVLPVYDSEGKINKWFGTNTDITSQIQIEQNLIESEARFRTMAENSDVLIALADETGNATYFNSVWGNLTGKPMEELLNFGWINLMHPDDRDNFLKVYLSAFEKQEAFQGEFRLLNKDGDYRWLLVKGPARFRTDGSFAGYISSFVDITQLKEIEKNLEQKVIERTVQLSDRNLFVETLLNSTVDVIVVVDKDLRYITVNNKAAELYKKVIPESIIGKKIDEVYPRLHESGMYNHITEAFKGIQITKKDYQAQLNNKYYELNFIPLKNEKEVYAVMILSRDVTENIIASQELTFANYSLGNLNRELQFQNQTFAHAESISKMGSYKWNLTTGKLDYSDNLFRLLDCEPQEFEPSYEKFLSFIHPQDLPQVISNGEQTVSTGVLVETPYRIISKKGNIKYFRSSGRFSGDGITKMLIGTVQDISDDVQASAELVEKNSELERANSELASFSYVASHDLQEPLRKIQTFANRLLEREGSNMSPYAKDYFTRIMSAAHRMKTLIEALLNFSRTNVAEINFVKTDLNKILKSVEEILHETITKQNAKIISDPLPVINAVPVQMNQLLLNILSNALKYSKKGVVPVIKITAEKIVATELTGHSKIYPPQWKISIQDNGIGFDQKFEHKIFEIFQRLHGKMEYEGTGIGLAICKKIMQTHNGTISATGEPGEGSVFIICLPENTNIN